MYYIAKFTLNFISILILIIMYSSIIPIAIITRFIWYISIDKLKKDIVYYYYDFFVIPYRGDSYGFFSINPPRYRMYKSEFHYWIGCKPVN